MELVQNKMLLDFIERVDQGIFLLDSSGVIMYSNRAMLSNLRETQASLVGINTLKLKEEGKTNICIYKQVIDTHKEIRAHQIFFNSLGVPFEIQVNQKPFFRNEKLDFILGTVDLFGRAAIAPNRPFSHEDQKLIFNSQEMLSVVYALEKASSSQANVLLLGETGVGKDMLASFVHSNSRRWNKPFVKINCAAIPENLLESELFGYEGGAFTGAQHAGKRGLVEEADTGTLFLDEINSLPTCLQGKVLTAIETKSIRRLGALKDRKVDFRLVTASNEDLEACVRTGTFRKDLYYRLSVMEVTIPPLRERKDDIISLANHFLEHFCNEYGEHISLSQDVRAFLQEYEWPGNVRELKSFIENMVIMGGNIGDLIRKKTGRPAKNAAKSTVEDYQLNEFRSTSLTKGVIDAERTLIISAIKNNRSLGAAAKALGITPSTLSRKIAKYNLKNT